MKTIVVLALAVLAASVPATAATPPPPPPPPKAPPGPPKPKETVAQSIFRIQVALRKKGCTARLKQLFHSAYGDVGAPGCKYLRQGFGTFKAPRGAEYGTGAVIDYATGYATPGTTVLALDTDGRFHVAFADFTYGSIGSAPNPLFDRNAKLAVEAIRRGDCQAFLGVAYRKFGLGGGSDASVCKRLGSNTLHRELADAPKAKPVKLGGNSLFAFYGLTVGTRWYTIVMAQQTASTKLPTGAARYAFVNAFPAG